MRIRGQRSQLQGWLVIGCVMAATVLALFGSPAAATKSVAQESGGKAKGPKIAGCDPKSSAKAQIPAPGKMQQCVTTEIEAWYHMTPGSTLPPEVPLGELPEQNPQYPEKTLHVGQRVGEEEARTYLTFDLSAIPVTATISDVVAYLPLDPDGGTAEARSASFQACLVDEPPEESEEGSLEQPPEAECSKTLSSVPAVYEEKPRPHFQLALGPLSDLLTPDVGVALVPNKTETQRTKTWHLAFYGRKNKDKDAEPVSALITFREAESPTFESPPFSDPLADSESSPTDPGGSFAAPSSSFGVGAPPGTIDSVTGGDQPLDPGGVGGDQQVFAAEPTAIRIDPGAYAVKWLVPLALLLGAAFWSFVLNREIKLPRR